MTYRSGVMTGVGVTLLAAGAAWWAFVHKPGDAAKPVPPPIPATVPKPFKEEAGVLLTPEAEARVAIQLGKVERKPMPRKRVYGGEVVVPPGRSIVVSAPLAGTLKTVPGVTLVPGLPVQFGQPVVHLLPLLDPVGRANLTASRVEADGQVQSAAEQLKVAQIALDRSKSILAGGAGRQRDVDEAQGQLDVAKKVLEAATARRDLLKKVVGDLEAGTATPMPIDAPEDGVLRNVTALPGQTVPAGAALFEVADLTRVWVRVPVYAGDLPDIDPDKSAAVGELTARPSATTRAAEPVSAPPTANPISGTVDLYYDLDNRRAGPAAAWFGSDALFNPGQRVGITLGLKAPGESLTVPWSAVVFDVTGGAWVYEKTGERAYARRRVVVRYVAGDTAVLESGPPPGTPVVTVGAAELFGTETGFSK